MNVSKMRKDNMPRILATLLISSIVIVNHGIMAEATESPSQMQTVVQQPVTAEFIMNAPAEYFNSVQVNPTEYKNRGGGSSISIDFDHYDYYHENALMVMKMPKGYMKTDADGFFEKDGEKYRIFSKEYVIDHNINIDHERSGSVSLREIYCEIIYRDGCKLNLEKRVFITETGEKIPLGDKFVNPVTESNVNTAEYFNYNIEDFVIRNSVLCKAYVIGFTEDMYAAYNRACAEVLSGNYKNINKYECYIYDRFYGLR